MSPNRPPAKGPKRASEPASRGAANPWASYDEADDWSITGDKPPSRADPTGMLKVPTGGGGGAPLPEPWHLIVHQAEGPARTYPLSHAEVTLGRGADNDVVLNDASVSRAHAKLTYEGGAWRLHDLDSGNGSTVAGERVTHVRLASPAAFALGQVQMRLEMQRRADAAPDRSRPQAAAASIRGAERAKVPAVPPVAAKPRRWGERLGHLRAGAGWAPRRRGAVLVAVVALALGGAWARAYYRHHQQYKEAWVHCARGITAFGEARWDEAEQALSDAQAAAPGHALSVRYAQALVRARGEAAQLADVRERREQGDVAAAQGKLRALAASPLVEAIWREGQANGHAVDQLAMQTETALGAGLVAEAGSLMAALDKAAPNRPDVIALGRWRSTREAHAPLEAAARALSQRARRIPSLWDEAQTQSGAMRRAIMAFRSNPAGSGPRLALALMHDPQTPEQEALVASLRRFTTAWQTALAEHRGKRAFAAIKLFGAARGEATKIAGDVSVPAREIDAKLADMYYVLGVQALMTGKLAEASEALRTALKLRPGHALSGRRLEELDERANRMVDEAEFISGSHASRAQELLRQVIEAMPASSDAARRARKDMQGLAPSP